jgi:GNAT superfamily N-acetyltransferase
MAPTYTLRDATDADFAFMLETKLEGMRPYIEAVWGWDREQQERLFNAKFDATRSRIVAVDGVDAGWIHVSEEPDTLFVVGIFLTAAVRRRGIGSAILRDLIDTAIVRGKSITLRVLKVNPARDLYERLGFSVTGEAEWHFLMRWSDSR